MGVEHWQKLRGMLAEEKISSYPVTVGFCCLRVVDGIRWDNQVLRVRQSTEWPNSETDVRVVDMGPVWDIA